MLSRTSFKIGSWMRFQRQGCPNSSMDFSLKPKFTNGKYYNLKNNWHFSVITNRHNIQSFANYSKYFNDVFIGLWSNMHDDSWKKFYRLTKSYRGTGTECPKTCRWTTDMFLSTRLIEIITQNIHGNNCPLSLITKLHN
jgi:hypothetical protein